jgi:hypothetical protein
MLNNKEPNMPFHKKEKPLLIQAIRMVYEAIAIAYSYKRDKNHMPTEDELKQLGQLEHALWECHATADYIRRIMMQRAAGEVEGARD